jgi:hypothetical protein
VVAGGVNGARPIHPILGIMSLLVAFRLILRAAKVL